MKVDNILPDMLDHVPAWRRITIKKNQEPTKDNDNDQEDDPLNITTHLATGSLTKKQKQRIIRREDRESSNANESSNKKFKNDKKKKEKLPKEEKNIRKQRVLKDQLKYLIDFYLTKVNPNNLPESLSSLSNVRNNYSEKFDADNQNDLDESSIIEIWKFSKQKQNWLIKNFFNIEEIPVEYDPLLLSYFKELKSPAIKDRLTSTCRAKTNEWNEYIEKQDEKMTKIIQEEDNAGEDVQQHTIQKHDNDGDDASEAKKQREEEGLFPPDRRIVNRSQELLKLWQSESLLELKKFYDD